MSIPPEKYRVREVDFSGHKWPIVLHARGGSSLLVALANAVLRAFDFRKAFKTEGGVRGRPKYVRTEVLFQILEMAVADRLQVLLRSKVIDEHAMVTAWKGCSDIIRLLPGDYSVDPIFTSCQAFADSYLEVLFSTLGFPVYHGWVIDPVNDPDTANAIGSKSFNEIFEILKLPPAEVEENTALLMKKFVDNTKDRLTSYGLTCLKESTADLDIGILFRYGHFSTLCKINGALVTLQATEEQFKKNPDAVWQYLEEVNDDGMLLLSNNLQVKKEAVITNAEEAIAVKRQEPIVEDEARDKLKISKPSSKQRRRARRAVSKSELEEVVACDKKTEPELKG